MAASEADQSSYSQQYLRQYNGDALRAVAIFFLLLVIACVSLRFYARKLGNVAWGLDDTLIIPSAIFCLAICSCTLGRDNDPCSLPRSF